MSVLTKLAIAEYAKRLTPIVEPALQLIVDEAIYKMLELGFSTIKRDSRGALEVSGGLEKYGGQLNAIEPDTLGVFLTTWDTKPIVNTHARSLSFAFEQITEHLGTEISTAGHVLRYLNNVAQVRARESDRWRLTAPEKLDGKKLFTIEKDNEGQTASLHQLDQATATPFTDTTAELLKQFDYLCPLPAGIGIGDGHRFEGELERLRPVVEKSVNEMSKRLPNVNFKGFFDPSITYGADSATADGLLKQTQAKALLDTTSATPPQTGE